MTLAFDGKGFVILKDSGRNSHPAAKRTGNPRWIILPGTLFQMLPANYIALSLSFPFFLSLLSTTLDQTPPPALLDSPSNTQTCNKKRGK